MSNNINDLRYFVEHLSQKEAKNVVYDNVSFIGVICEILNGYYRVQLIEGDSSSLISATALNQKQSYSKDESVYLLKARSQSGDTFQDSYYILGSCQQIDKKQENAADLMWNSFTALASDSSKMNIAELEVEQSEWFSSQLIQHLNKQKYFSIMACINSNLSSAIVKDYGIQIDLHFISLKSGNLEIDKSIYFGVNDFEGNPYKLNDVYQKKIFNLNDLGISDDYQLQQGEIKRYFIDSDGTEGSDIDGIKIKDITIQAGIFKDVSEDNFTANIALVDGNVNYFVQNEDNEEKIELEASLLYEGQKMETAAIKYYWCVKDPAITVNHPDYFSIAGEGWRVLNQFSTTKMISMTNQALAYRDYQASFSTWTLHEDDGYLQKYENIVKCILEYNNIQISSNELTIYNYNKFNFSVELSSKSKSTGENMSTIHIDIDEILVSCNVDIGYHPAISQLEYEYNWNITIDGNKEDAEELTTEDTIVFYYNKEEKKDKLNYFNLYKEGADEGKVAICSCTVRLKRKGEQEFLDLQESEEISVATDIQWNTESKTEYYYFWILNNSAVSFEENIDLTPPWDCQVASWEKYEPTDSTLSLEENFAKTRPPYNMNGMVYQYQTECTVFVREDGEIVSRGNWTKPIVVKHGRNYVGNFTPASQNLINEINTFNSLTQNGEKDAMVFDPESGDLYINATYIQTGTLRVAGKTKDENGNEVDDERFFASMHDQDVRIGGFTVAENSLSHGEEKQDNYIYLGTDKLQIGDWLVLTPGFKAIPSTVKFATEEGDYTLVDAILKWGGGGGEVTPTDTIKITFDANGGVFK